MDMKNNGSGRADRKTVKGFTLVELIVVIAIIVILMGIMNLMMQSYVRNARQETANDNAHLLYTGFQNMLIQCEIKQDQSLFDVDHTKGKLEYAVVTFQIVDTNVRDTFTIRCKYASESSEITDTWTKDSTDAVPGASGVTKGDKYKDLVDAIRNNVDNTFSGSMRVYIDYENYEVKSAIYQSWNANAPTLNMIAENNYIKYDNWYYGLNNRAEQRDLCSGKKLTGAENAPEKLFTCGVYPYQDTIT